MVKKWFTVSLVVLLCVLGTPLTLLAQEVTGQQPATAQEDKDKPSPEKKAVALLEVIVAEAAALKLPENRIRIQIAVADLLWDHNEERARSLFEGAAAGINQMAANTTQQNANRRQNQRGVNMGGGPGGIPSGIPGGVPGGLPGGPGGFGGNNQTAFQLRQNLVMTAARHNSTLAIQLLQSTQQQQLPAATTVASNGRQQPDMEANLEQRLMAQIARTDPLMALKGVEETLDKGQYSNAMAQVLGQLHLKDKDAAAKFSDKLLKRIQSENLLLKQDAGNLALALLRPGPRPPESPTDSAKSTTSATTQTSSVSATPSGGIPTLNEAAFNNLLDTVITAALKATPPTPGAGGGGGRGQGPGGNFRGGQNRPGGNNASQQQTDAQREQMAARQLLMGLQSLMPQIDKYQPARASAVRQKLTQMGVDDSPRAAFGQIADLIQQGTSESLLTAAATAPANMQPMLYQQAASKAISEGNFDRARQIANDHLNPAQRNPILQMAEAQQIALKAGDDQMEEVRQALARLSSDEERVRMLLQMSATAQKDNPKLAARLLDEAQKYVSGRVSNYQQFELQLQVARAFAAIDPARSFEVLEPGINQLNELLAAAALLSGFEVNIFQDGELPIQGGSRLTNMVSGFGAELAGLAKSDFERAQSTADKFQLLEVRINARLAIARGILGEQPLARNNNGFGNRGVGQNPAVRRQ